VLKSGCPWRLLPRDFPTWETVCLLVGFGRWRTDGAFEHLNAALGERLRTSLGAGACGTERGYRRLLPVCEDHRRRSRREQRGYDGNKKIRGRKRHLLVVDTEGLVLSRPRSTAAPTVPTQDGLRLLLEPARSGISRLSHLWLDAGYQGRGKRWAEEVLWV
jgi:putative transposase